MRCPNCNSKKEMTEIKNPIEENYVCHECKSKWLIVFVGDE